MAAVPTLEELLRFEEISNSFFGLLKDDATLKAGLHFTVKDIFNMSFRRMGSELWKGFKAGNNARVISMALNAGHKFLGKTVTSEFAVHNPTVVSILGTHIVRWELHLREVQFLFFWVKVISPYAQSGASISSLLHTWESMV